MSTDYLPKRDTELRDFSLNFSTLISAAPATYGLTENDATQIAAAAQAFADKMELLQSPPTRTSPNVAAKDDARAQLVAVVRGYAMHIKTNRAVSNEAKTALGLGVPDFQRTPIGQPQTHPIVTVVASGTRQHELRFADELTPDSGRKPAGVTGLQLFCRISDTPPASPLSSDFMDFVSRHIRKVNFLAEDVGKRAYYSARWQTATGLTGPWSVMSSRMIAE